MEAVGTGLSDVSKSGFKYSSATGLYLLKIHKVSIGYYDDFIDIVVSDWYNIYIEYCSVGCSF